MRFKTPTLLAIVCALSSIAVVLAEAPPPAPAAASSWPHWRGPTGNGVSPEGQPPLSWSASKNVAWKTAIQGSGSASPVVWGDRVFVATAVPAAAASGRDKKAPGDDKGGGRGRDDRAPPAPHRFLLLAVDRASGKIVWERAAIETTPHQGHHQDHGFASASPCTDGERVYAHFGSRGLYCYDFKGELVWKHTEFGAMDTRNSFGEGSSPTLYQNAVIVPWDHEGPSYLAVFDKRSGKRLWKVDRDEPSCWATPLVVEHDGKAQIIVSGENFARGYDFATGEELWRCSGQTGRPVASPVAGHGMAFIGSGFRGAFLGAFRLEHRGDLKGTDGVAWSLDRFTPDVPSPLLSGRRLYFHSARTGIVSCHDAPTGKALFSAQRVEGLGDVYASPVAAAGRIYLTGRDGTTVVIEDGDALKVLAASPLGEPVDATPAIAGKELFIRGRRHLYCIRE
jgi:hypothetical protein